MRRSLAAKALGLFAALAILVGAEVVLSVRLFQDVERHSDELESVDAVQRQLVGTVIQVRDLLLDVEFADTTADRHGLVGHWLTDLTVMLLLDGAARERIGLERIAVIDDIARRAERLWQADAITQDAIISLGEEIETEVGLYNTVLLAQIARLEQERAAIMEHATSHRRSQIVVMAVLGVLGLSVMGAIGGLFLMRLLAATRALGAQATRIARGEYGHTVAVRREDEIGQVVEAVNAMSTGLATRERELAGLRSRYGQQERMFAMGVLAAQMAHELGNPIQAIMALSLHAADGLREDQSRENVFASIDHLEVIAQHAHRLTGTVRDIREFARPERLERELVDLNEVVEDTVRLMRFERRFARAGVELDLAPTPLILPAVRDHLVQVLINLLINAADAVPQQGGRITVRTQAEDGWMAFGVEDNGCGMEEEVRALVFEAFFTTKLSENGTGLGLTICKQIIQDHGGRIAIDSTVGKGTTVTVRLPEG